MKIKDERIIKFIEDRHSGEMFDIDKFVNPSEADFRDANLFFDVDKIVGKIKIAISEKKSILVYGDYDCDGISASTILYLHLKSMGANVQVFIPNRFENGYGISIDAIEEILSDFAPDLIITVDLGITAVEEVEILKQEGVDIIVTDHHIPLECVPDCLILDPKHNNEKYGFDALCGAGVAMKLVEALSGRAEANKYLDIAAIATVGDIVPLVDENRAIAKLGIDKINSGDCLKSLSFLKNKLELEKVTSTDISFKIVPRLNACGRMDNAIKVFEFLIEQDEHSLEERYAEIESDNNLRLAAIDKGVKQIEKCLEKFEITDPSVLVEGDFHEGVIGILASRVCHEFNKPAIIFTKTESGTLKGSGRSIPSVDLHKIISGIPDLLVNFGGHKMAVGVEIEPESFEEFRKILNQKISEETKPADFLIDDAKFDIEICEDDFSEDFVKQVNMLEPFGCENEKPVFAIKQKKMFVEPISEKAFKHYRCFTEKNHSIVGFNFYNNVPILKTETEKLFLLDLGLSTFKGKTSVNALAKSVKIMKPVLSDDVSADKLSALYNLYYSIFDFNDESKYHIESNLGDIVKQKFAESEYGTIVVASTNEDLKLISELELEKYISNSPHSNAQNVVVVSPKQIYSIDMVKGYKNIIFLHRYFDNEHLYFSQKMDVYENDKKLKFSGVVKDRDVFVNAYKHIMNFSALKANDVLDLVEKLAIKNTSISSVQMLFCLIVFMELNFIEFDEILNSLVVLKAKKMELDSSKFYNTVE